MKTKRTSRRQLAPKHLRQTVLTQGLAGLEGLQPKSTPAASRPITYGGS